MKFRNATHNENNSIDCEVLVDNEWIPFTASPDDPEEFGRVLFSGIESTLPPKEESSE